MKTSPVNRAEHFSPDHLDDADAIGSGAPAGALPARMVERIAALDRAVPTIRRVTAPLARPPLDRIFLGKDLGHAVHPTLSDLPIGFWTSAVTLDACGGLGSRTSATRLMGIGVLTAVPTAWSGWAEWHRLPRPESRVATLHGLLNGAAVALFGSSWIARQTSHHRAGVWCGMAGTVAASAAGYLGGHLTGVRHAGYRDTAYAHDGVGPLVSRPPLA